MWIVSYVAELVWDTVVDYPATWFMRICVWNVRRTTKRQFWLP